MSDATQQPATLCDMDPAEEPARCASTQPARWKAWWGPHWIVVMGRTREDALIAARARGIEPDVLVCAGGMEAVA